MSHPRHVLLGIALLLIGLSPSISIPADKPPRKSASPAAPAPAAPRKPVYVGGVYDTG